ncbi:MAG: PA2778 family cysteine peptidase [Geminicoccaceae bacterium]
MITAIKLPKIIKPLVMGMMALGLAACAAPPNRMPEIEVDGLSPRVELTSVPFHPQSERDDCGPAALAMMLGWTGHVSDPSALASQVYTPGRNGTLQADIVQATRRAGRLAVPVGTLTDMLVELNAGNPVLVLQNLGSEQRPQWHYAVAMGYDLDTGTLRLHSGKDARFPLSFQAFEQSWKASEQWGLTVTRPDHLPNTAGETITLEAANGLEQAGQQDAATLAYGAILQRWPDSLIALMGWGNARYAADDVQEASKAFRHAVTLHPDAAQAWNNLAHSLAEQDRLEAALDAAQRAVSLGGPYLAAAKATLAEIQAKRG